MFLKEPEILALLQIFYQTSILPNPGNLSKARNPVQREGNMSPTTILLATPFILSVFEGYPATE